MPSRWYLDRLGLDMRTALKEIDIDCIRGDAAFEVPLDSISAAGEAASNLLMDIIEALLVFSAHFSFLLKPEVDFRSTIILLSLPAAALD